MKVHDGIKIFEADEQVLISNPLVFEELKGKAGTIEKHCYEPTSGGTGMVMHEIRGFYLVRIPWDGTYLFRDNELEPATK